MDKPPVFQKRRTLIIGYGNPLRGDDAFGLRVADRLAAIPEIAADPLIRIETVHQLMPELSEAMAEADFVLFIDAAAPSSGRPPGTLHFEAINAEKSSHEALGHHLTPQQALAYAKVLFGVAPKAWIASVTAQSFDYGAPLSPTVQAAIPAVIHWTRERISALS